MDTKQRILDEALTLFSEKGYANVFVGEIAGRVGIKAPSLYKHYKSKQAIFDAIIEVMHRHFLEQAKLLNIRGNDPKADAEIYSGLPEEELVRLGINLFLYQIIVCIIIKRTDRFDNIFVCYQGLINLV